MCILYITNTHTYIYIERDTEHVYMCICVYIIVLFVHLGGTIFHLLRNHVHNALLNLWATGAVHAPSTSPMCS